MHTIKVRVMIVCLDLDWDLDLGLLTPGSGVGIVTLLWVLPHPDDLLHVHCGLVLSFV